MSPSLPPPPRKLSASGAPSHSSSSHHHHHHRYPKINPNATAAAAAADDSNPEEDEQLDKALAELLGETRLLNIGSGGGQHLPQCKHYSGSAGTGARPLSITSVSSLSSGSYSSFGSNSTHSRRVSQAYLSPLSPALSEPSTNGGATSYFSTLPEERDESKQQLGNEDDASLQQDMAMAASSLPSCTYCSSVRSNSICSSGSPQDPSNTNDIGLGLHSPTHSSFTTTSTTRTAGTSLHAHHRHSMQAQQFFEQSRLQVLKEQIPTEIRHRLTYHLDECWFVHFSPSGQYLASTGLDQSIMIWQDVMTPEPRIYKTFQYSRSVTHVEWSPDSQYLLVNLGFDALTPGYAPEFYLIEIATGEVVLTTRHKDDNKDIHVNAIAWLPDSKRFVTAPQHGLVCIWNLKGEVVDEFSIGDNTKISKICMIPDQNAAVICTSDCTGVTSLCRPAQILIFDMESMALVRTLEADTYVNQQFIIMPAFFGPNDEILCSGSENGTLNFWDVETGELISVNEEHSKHSGWVSSHPSTQGVMASCSDDNHIIIWVTKELSRALQDDDEKWMENRRSTIKMPKIDLKKGW
ncbi:hypothetical protein BGZ83_007570 [Gryganskiella cystojenkinii]|nr:hypothetical protein BGZ83_007570 [Gryganskiella cystojenkinii]